MPSPEKFLSPLVHSRTLCVPILCHYPLWFYTHEDHAENKYFLANIRVLCLSEYQFPHISFSFFFFFFFHALLVLNLKNTSICMKFISFHYHAYQSFACETAINTDFSELFSLKLINVKYINAILSLIDCFFRT